ncbi:hypothetical protein VTO73DRAFT_1112 [Trametes versicolor]
MHTTARVYEEVRDLFVSLRFSASSSSGLSCAHASVPPARSTAAAASSAKMGRRSRASSGASDPPHGRSACHGPSAGRSGHRSGQPGPVGSRCMCRISSRKRRSWTSPSLKWRYHSTAIWTRDATSPSSTIRRTVRLLMSPSTVAPTARVTAWIAPFTWSTLRPSSIMSRTRQRVASGTTPFSFTTTRSFWADARSTRARRALFCLRSATVCERRRSAARTASSSCECRLSIGICLLHRGAQSPLDFGHCLLRPELLARPLFSLGNPEACASIHLHDRPSRKPRNIVYHRLRSRLELCGVLAQLNAHTIHGVLGLAPGILCSLCGSLDLRFSLRNLAACGKDRLLRVSLCGLNAHLRKCMSLGKSGSRCPLVILQGDRCLRAGGPQFGGRSGGSLTGGSCIRLRHSDLEVRGFADLLHVGPESSGLSFHPSLCLPCPNLSGFSPRLGARDLFHRLGLYLLQPRLGRHCLPPSFSLGSLQLRLQRILDAAKSTLASARVVELAPCVLSRRSGGPRDAWRGWRGVFLDMLAPCGGEALLRVPRHVIEV